MTQGKRHDFPQNLTSSFILASFCVNDRAFAPSIACHQ